MVSSLVFVRVSVLGILVWSVLFCSLVYWLVWAVMQTTSGWCVGGSPGGLRFSSHARPTDRIEYMCFSRGGLLSSIISIV